MNTNTHLELRATRLARRIVWTGINEGPPAVDAWGRR
jgi:hypothetical protein